MIYAITFALLGQFALRRYGSKNSGGSPRWRNALGLLPQVIVMPSLLSWSLASSTWAPVAERTFVYIFPSLLIFDFLALQLNTTMVLHHSVCLLGHIYAFLNAPEAFWYYFAAVVLLEAGSGTSCIWWLIGDILGSPPPSCSTLYKVGMSLSNAMCVWCLANWSLAAGSLGLAGRIMPIPITAVLIHGRQTEMMGIMKHGRGACTTG